MTEHLRTAPSASPPTGVRVRPMQPGDTAPLRAVMRRAFDRFDQLLYSTRGREVLVAVDRDDTPVGGVVLHATPAPDRPAPNGRLGIVHWIFADPQAGIPGIGTALRDAADERFGELGCTETSARIDAVNTASQALHRSGGYHLASGREQLRRWGWRLPQRWLQAGHGFDPGMQLWLRPDTTPATPTPARWTRLAATWLLNAALLAVIAWRAPRGEAPLAVAVGTAVLAAGLLLGVREAAIRLTARAQHLDLGHAPWGNAVGLSGALALAFGVWLPLTGSSTPRATRWRHDVEVPRLGRAHLVGGLAVAALAWTTVLVEPDLAWISWPDLRRAAVMLALIDLVVPVSPLIGTAARHVREWSTAAWVPLAVLGLGPLLLTLPG